MASSLRNSSCVPSLRKDFEFFTKSWFWDLSWASEKLEDEKSSSWVSLILSKEVSNISLYRYAVLFTVPLVARVWGVF